MKKTQTTVLIALLFTLPAFAQPAFNPVEKGNKQLGLQMMVAPTDIYWSETTLAIGNDIKRYGIHLAGSYGWFLERGWMLGLQVNGGIYHNEYDKLSSWGYEEDYFDISIAPMTRYYFTVDKKHRFKPFLFAGLPIVYTSENRTYNNNNSNSNMDDEYLELRGTFGFGAAYFGKAGSIEMNLSNMGLFLGVNKFFPARKK
jgi:hypothetical protein